jgi:hypothetical protein
LPNILAYLRFLDLSEAGGIRYEQPFYSMDQFTEINTGDGGTGLSYGVLRQSAGGASGGTSFAAIQLAFSHFEFSWNKKRIFKTKIRLTIPNVATAFGRLFTGYIPEDVPSPGIGFRFDKNGIYGYSIETDTPLEVLIYEFTSLPYETLYSLEYTLYPGSRVEFKVNDGVSDHVANLQTGLPTGLDEARTFFGGYVSSEDANHIVAEYCTFYFFQDI